MTNIIKNTLVEKQASIEAQLEAAALAKQELLEFRAKGFFAKALEEHPEVSIKISYLDSLSFKMDNKDILSIDSRGFDANAKYYLNTYSTWIESDFEIQRLIFNGKIASIIGSKDGLDQVGLIFSKEGKMAEIAETMSTLRSELSLIKSEINRINREELLEKQAKVLENFYKGEEVIFDKMKIITYGRGKYDGLHRVVKLKCIDKNASGKKITVEFTSLSYDTNVEIVNKIEGIQTKYLVGELI
jgi:hypothetical protein